MAMPYLPSCFTSALFALPLQLLPTAFCQLVSSSSGNGTQARAMPKESFTSTRVTVSNVRHPVAADSAAAAARQGSDWATATAEVDFRKFLRFMRSLLGTKGGEAGNGGARPDRL